MRHLALPLRRLAGGVGNVGEVEVGEFAGQGDGAEVVGESGLDLYLLRLLRVLLLLS